MRKFRLRELRNLGLGKCANPKVTQLCSAWAQTQLILFVIVTKSQTHQPSPAPQAKQAQNKQAAVL